MENCIACGAPTTLFIHNRPVCLKCDLLPVAARVLAAQQYSDAQLVLAAKV